MAGSRTFTEYEELASLHERKVDERRAEEAAAAVRARERAGQRRVPPFAHLSARTGYSLRDGVIRPRELAAAAAAAGMTHVAVTDRDGLYGAVRVAQACADHDVTPVFGAEVKLRPHADRPAWSTTRGGRARTTGDARPSRGPAWLEDDAPRVTFVAATQAGYGDLCRTLTATHLGADAMAALATPGAGDWREHVDLHDRSDPHLDADDVPLAARHDGVHVLLGWDSPVGRLLAVDRRDAAADELRHWLEVFGTGRVHLAVRNHHVPPAGRRLGRAVRITVDGTTIDEPGDDVRIRRTLGLAADLGVRTVATNDVRYLAREDAYVADVLTCVRQQVQLGQHHLERTTAEAWFTTAAEMADRFAERPDLLVAAHDLATSCEVDLGLGELLVPRLTGMSDEVAAGELQRRTWQGVADRYPRVTPRIRQRLERELAMVDRLGLHDYFLAVGDIMADVRRELGILASCRGSAAGSLVCYALRISDVDPVGNDLAFERFMNPYRDELPDIDIDVESARREDVYDLVIAKYGQHRTACVAMVETFQARMAIREAGKVLGLPADEIGHVATSFTHARARNVMAVLENLPELKGSNIDAGQLTQLFQVVERLDGLPRHMALHPCGILLADDHLMEFTPLERSARGFPMVSFDKDDVAALGWLKLDVLGVRMLSAMRHCLELIPDVRGEVLDVDDIPGGDPDTFELVRSTQTIGMFQIESPGQRELLGRLQPDHFGDLVTEISLFRPGPVKADMVTPFVRRRHGQEEAEFLHPALEPVLRETHGVVVYHEQVMGCLAALTGCDMSYADFLRRNLSDDDKRPAIKAWALARAHDRGFDPDVAASVWKQVASFASFGFCKAHAAAFAVPTYRSAWFKAHRFPEMMAGLLTHDPGMYPRRLILEECRNFGVAVLPVDVNHSYAHETVEIIDRGRADHLLGLHQWRRGRGDLPPGWVEVGDELVPPSGFDKGDAGGGYRYGVRLGFAHVKGITEVEMAGLVDGRPYTSLKAVREGAGLSRPTAEHLAEIGAFDHVAGVGRSAGVATRRHLQLAVGELWATAARRAPRASADARPEQVSLDLHADHQAVLPAPTDADHVRRELAVVGMDVSRHVVSFYEPLLEALGCVRVHELVDLPTQQRVRVAGVKVAVQSPAQRSGSRVLFLSLDDRTGSTQVTYFQSSLEDCAWTVKHAWLLVCEGRVSRRGVGRRGVTVTGTRAWDLSRLWRAWQEGWLPEALNEIGTPAPHERTVARPEGLTASEWGRGSR